MTQATVLIVPGLRDDAPEHWQTRLAAKLERVRSVPPLGRENLDLGARVAAIDHALQSIEGPVIVVAHSAGALMVVHWAARSTRAIRGALLAAPADLETSMPAGYPALDALREHGWLPIPRARLPFPAIVAASRNDPLARFDRVQQMADDWGARCVDLGEVGHLNPASGYGEWPYGEELVRELI